MTVKNLKIKLKENNLPELAAYFLLGIALGLDVEVLKLSKRHVQALFKLGFLSFRENILRVNPNCFEETETEEEAPIKTNLEEYRALFKGLKPGSMGDPASVFEKIQRWRINNPQYSWEQIIKKTKEYIKQKKDLGEEKFIPQADYFIYKMNILTREEKSVLSSIIDDETAVTVEHYQSL
jgi:hypothetical protein